MLGLLEFTRRFGLAKNGRLAHYNPKLIKHAIGRNIEFCSPTKFWFKQIKITKLAADPGEEEG